MDANLTLLAREAAVIRSRVLPDRFTHLSVSRRGGTWDLSNVFLSGKGVAPFVNLVAPANPKSPFFADAVDRLAAASELADALADLATDDDFLSIPLR